MSLSLVTNNSTCVYFCLLRVMNVVMVPENIRIIYLTIIPRARVGYEMVDSQRGVAELAITISYPNKARVE